MRVIFQNAIQERWLVVRAGPLGGLIHEYRLVASRGWIFGIHTLLTGSTVANQVDQTPSRSLRSSALELWLATLNAASLKALPILPFCNQRRVP